MHLKTGDSVVIENLNTELEKDRQHIYNTTLFVEVVVEPVIVSAFDFDINIVVKERWYIFPVPELDFIDGSFNDWLMKSDGDWTRVNYGIKFIDNNLTGRKDHIRLFLLNGYTRTINFDYRAPYTNSKLTEGMSVGGGYYQNREVAYKTSYDNSLVYYKKRDFVESQWNAQVTYSIRKAIKTSQFFGINYTHVNIDDSLVNVKYNSDYFNRPTSKIGYVDLWYTLQYLDVDNILYPLSGKSYDVTITKRGLGFSGGINLFSIQSSINKFWPLGKKWFVSTQFRGNIKLPFNQPYINQDAMGRGAYLRGLEEQVIDGVAWGILKTNLKKELFNFSVPFIKRSKTFNKIPFRIYAKTFADLGYSYTKEDYTSRLNNKLLYSAGFGLDIVTFYDVQLRLEYSFNQLGQNGLFLHNDKGF